jgi:hypothetical protein
LSNLTQFLAPGFRGIRANLVPGLVLQAFALSIVIGYGVSPDLHLVLDTVGVLKETGGYAFSLISTALFGGVLPFLILWLSGRIPRSQVIGQLTFYTLFWGWKGLEVDAFYRVQTLLFGESGSVHVVMTKVLVDQFVYNPLWAAPTQTLFFLWKDANFSRAVLMPRLHDTTGFAPFRAKLLAVLFSTWVVWIPAVSIVYSLPSALQLPIFNLVLCFWCLLLTFVSQPNV